MLTREMIITELQNKGYTVEATDVVKNGIEYSGIVIGTDRVRPNIYVNDLLDKPLNEVIDYIISTYEMAKKEAIEVGNVEEWDGIKTRLQLCLQRKGNENIVKRDFLDLEQYVRVIVTMGNNGVGSFKVQPNHLKMWGVDETQLFNAAWDCTRPTLVKEDMLEVMKQMMGAGATEAELLAMLGDAPRQIILSNQSKVHGSIAMCDTWLLGEIADEHETDLAILPSSIHEVIVIPVTEDMRFSELDTMVQEVNETQVAPEEWLSDHAYRFNRVTREIV